MAQLLVLLLLLVFTCNTLARDIVVLDTGIGYAIEGAFNPPIEVTVGESITFDVTSAGNPFFISTSKCTNLTKQTLWRDGIQQPQNGTVPFTWWVSPLAWNHTMYYCSWANAAYGSVVLIRQPPTSCTGLADGQLCDDLDPCTQGSSCVQGNCIGYSPIICNDPQNTCDLSYCSTVNGSCIHVNASDGASCDDGNNKTVDTCDAGECIGVIPNDDSNGVANLYLVFLWSVGGSIWILTGMIRNHKLGWRNQFVILPIISLSCAVSFVIIDLNLLFETNLSDQTRRRLETAQWSLDTPSTVAIELAYWLRLQVALKAAQATGMSPIWKKLSYVCLIVPLTWPCCDILAINCLYYPELAALANGNFQLIVVAAWNIALAINDITMHWAFVYLVLQMTTDHASSRKRNTLIFVAALLSLNPLGTLTGAVWAIWNGQIGNIIMYSVWMNNTFVFLLLNKAVSKATKRSKGTGSSAPSTTT